jgi:hypothetical protein
MMSSAVIIGADLDIILGDAVDEANVHMSMPVIDLDGNTVIHMIKELVIVI